LPVILAKGIHTYALQETEQRVGGSFRPERLETRDRIAFEGETLDVYYPGPGHAPDNVVVYRDRDHVLVGGCLVKDRAATGLGNVADADLERWAEAIYSVERTFKQATLVVPGHGAVGSRDLLTHTKTLLSEDAGE
jgi:glyoxylase-like metal-dependent hydrolase (beta-lactamase superfamily II)